MTVGPARPDLRRATRLAALLLASAALAACNSPLNILRALDGPYISPEQRAEMAYRAAQEQQRLENEAHAAAQPAPVAQPAPAPVAAPAPASAPAPQADPAATLVGPPAPPAAELARPAPAIAPAALAQPAATAPPPAPAAAPAPAAPAPSIAPAPPAARTPLPAPAIAAPVSPISPAAGLMGPVATREERPAALETRLPSAFDFAPAQADPVQRRPVPAAAPAPAPDPAPRTAELPAMAQVPAVATPPPPVPAPAAAPAPAAPSRELQRAAAAAGLAVVSAMPAPAAPVAGPPGSGDTLRAFFDFASARLDALPDPAGRESMLLADPPSLDPALKRCGTLPPAVLIDLDPGNGLLPLVSNDAANPDLARYLGLLRERGVTVYWISGHGPGAASQIRQRLLASGLDPAGADPLIVTRFAGESKQARRYGLGESNCVLAIMGDQRGDFDELYDYVLDPIMAAPLEEHVNHGWFIAPPPLN